MYNWNLGIASAIALFGCIASPTSFAKSAIDDISTPTVGAFSRACQPVRMAQRGERLTSDQELVAGMCFGYFMAEADGDPLAMPHYCAPSNVNLEQRVLIFLKWADDNPSQLSLDRNIGVQLSLIAAFPCPN